MAFVFSRILALVLGATLLVSSLAKAQDVLDGIAAVVNGDVITFSQVRDIVGPQERALRDKYKGEELVTKIKELRLAAIKELVDRQLIVQEFHKNKFNIPDYVIDDRVQTIIREEFGGDRRAFIRTLEAQGYTLNRFRQNELEKIIVQAMRQNKLKSELVIPPHKIEEYYARHHEEYSVQDEVKLRMIVLRKDSNAEGGGPRKMAEEIRAKVAAGGEFEKMAQMYSEDSTQSSGGDWGWINRHTLNDELTKVAFSLKPGQVSKVVESGGNFYLLFVEAKKVGGAKPLKDVRDDIEKKLLSEERQRAQEKWLVTLRQKAYVKIF